MSHSTHVGFRLPPTSALSGFVFRRICEGAPFFFESFTVGVGHIFTCADSFGSPRLLIFPLALFTESSATGVCHIIVGNFLTAVGHNPDSVSFVWSTGIDCTEHSPRRIIPH